MPHPSKHPTPRPYHIPNIPHLEHPTSHIPNIPHPKHPMSQMLILRNLVKRGFMTMRVWVGVYIFVLRCSNTLFIWVKIKLFWWMLKLLETVTVFLVQVWKKNSWDFKRQFTHSHQCFNNFCIVILAQQ